MAEECNISFGSCQGILTEKLQLRRVAAKFIPRLMTKDQKQRRVHENFLRTIITGDETWVYWYNGETKAQSSQWKTYTSP
jgi:hypothetical protein